MSFTERSGLLPVLLLSGCASPVVVTGPPSGSVVDGYLTRSAADISAMQYRVHQTGPAAQRPASTAAKPVKPLTPGNPGGSALTNNPAAPPPASEAGTGSGDGFIRQDGVAPTLRAALRKIVPPGQTVVFDKAVPADAPELWRWTGNDRWQYVADKMLATRGLKVTVDEKTHKLMIESARRPQSADAGLSALPSANPGKVGSVGAVNPMPPAAYGRNPFRGEKDGGPVPRDKPAGLSGPATHAFDAATTPASAVRLRHWRIETGSTVKNWLYSQASAETCHVPGIKNWTIAWLTPFNYRVDAPLNFDGDFREMLNHLFTLYGTAKVPLYAGVRAAQCIVSVDDKEVN